MLVLAISALLIGVNKKVTLVPLPCINYPVQFQKDDSKTRALLNNGSKVNAISPAYAEKLCLQVPKTDVSAQKIDGSILETFEMVITSFQVEGKLKKACFFQETFLVANTSMKIVLKMFFLAFSNANVSFADNDLIWKTYIVDKALPTTKCIQIINRKEFAKATLDPN